jgi:hypothetical protein
MYQLVRVQAAANGVTEDAVLRQQVNALCRMSAGCAAFEVL